MSSVVENRGRFALTISSESISVTQRSHRAADREHPIFIVCLFQERLASCTFGQLREKNRERAS